MTTNRSSNFIWIVDYGVGNLGSLRAAFSKLGYETKIALNDNDLINANKIVFPGVGSAKTAMSRIKNDFSQLVIDSLIQDESKTLLGICLGMQIFATESLENGEIECLDYLKGKVRKLSPEISQKVPRLGWFPINLINMESEKRFSKLQNFDKQEFYFAHSYYFDIENPSLVRFDTAQSKIPAMISYKNLIGVQFHPEKSGKVGLAFLDYIINSNHSRM